MKHFGILPLSALIFSIPIEVLAAVSNYVPLAPIPGANTNTWSLAGFFNGLFSFGIIAASILAVVMIALAGIQYMTTESFTDKSASKGRIKDAVLGLLLALLIYLVLYVINPNLLNINLSPSANQPVAPSAQTAQQSQGIAAQSQATPNANARDITNLPSGTAPAPTFSGASPKSIENLPPGTDTTASPRDRCIASGGTWNQRMVTCQ